MPKDTKDLASLIIAVYPNIRRVFRHLVSLKDAPISMTQLTCLAIINRDEQLTMTMLAKKLNMSNQQLTKVVDDLEDYEMVFRHVDEDNRRQILVQIAPKGKDTITALIAEIDRKLKFALRRQEADGLDKLYDSLAYITGYFANIESKE